MFSSRNSNPHKSEDNPLLSYDHDTYEYGRQAASYTRPGGNFHRNNHYSQGNGSGDTWPRKSYTPVYARVPHIARQDLP